MLTAFKPGKVWKPFTVCFPSKLKENFLRAFEDDWGVKVFTKNLQREALGASYSSLSEWGCLQETAGITQNFANHLKPLHSKNVIQSHKYRNSYQTGETNTAYFSFPRAYEVFASSLCVILCNHMV